MTKKTALVRPGALCEIARPLAPAQKNFMSFIQNIQPLFILSGFGVGFLVGITGVGGGSLMTPLLILLFGVHPVTAVGTDLIYASITKTGGTLVHGIGGTIDWRIVRRLALGSLPASVLTIGLVKLFAVDPAAYSAVVTRMLGGALVLTALAVLFRKKLLAGYASRVGVLDEGQILRFTVITGVVLGVLVTVTSVGAGALGVTALLLLYPELPVARIAGSDIAHAVPLTLVAGLGHLSNGDVDVTMLTSLLLGSLPGIMIASRFAPRLPDTALRVVLAATLGLVAIRLLA